MNLASFKTIYPVRKPRPLGRLGCNIYTFSPRKAGWVQNPALSNGVYSSLATRSSEKGVSLYLAILIMGILLAASLGLTTLSLLQIQTIKGMGDSVSAFYAAEAGIEKELYVRNPIGTQSYEENLDTERKYKITIFNPGEGNCRNDANYCIESVGFYHGTRRALRLTR